MKPRDIFKVGVRLVGLMVAVYLLKSMAHNVFNYRGLSTLVQLGVKSVCLLGAIYGIGGAPLLVRFAFAGSRDDSDVSPRQSYQQATVEHERTDW